MTGIIGILLALVLLMYLAYRGISVLILASTTALLAVLFEGSTPILAIYTQIFMGALGNIFVLYFPLFLLGALFGKLMEDSGSAQAIDKWIVNRLGKQRSIFAVVLSCAVLTSRNIATCRAKLRSSG